jgi:peptidyl-prolyl cis-trans isomerase A (cyclophilin A)
VRNKRAAAILAMAVALANCSSEVKQKKVERVPDIYKVKFETSKGDFVVEVTHEWAPHGADRFHELVQAKFYDEARFFRVLPDFVVQFGIAAEPKTSALWRDLRIPDDPVKQGNKKGTVTFATSGPASRTTQVFINLGDNDRLDEMGFSPFGRVVSGMDVIEQFYKGYGEGAPRGNGPRQDRIQSEGNEYLAREFPRLDYIKQARVTE